MADFLEDTYIEIEIETKDEIETEDVTGDLAVEPPVKLPVKLKVEWWKMGTQITGTQMTKSRDLLDEVSWMDAEQRVIATHRWIEEMAEKTRRRLSQEVTKCDNLP